MERTQSVHPEKYEEDSLLAFLNLASIVNNNVLICSIFLITRCRFASERIGQRLVDVGIKLPPVKLIHCRKRFLR